MHPLAIEGKSAGNVGAWNEVHAGDRIIYLIDGRIGTLDECMHDGDAFVTWDNGTFETVKWHHLAPTSKVRVTDDRWEAIRERE